MCRIELFSCSSEHKQMLQDRINQSQRERSLTSDIAFKQGCISQKYHIKKALMFLGMAVPNENEPYGFTEETVVQL